MFIFVVYRFYCRIRNSEDEYGYQTLTAQKFLKHSRSSEQTLFLAGKNSSETPNTSKHDSQTQLLDQINQLEKVVQEMKDELYQLPRVLPRQGDRISENIEIDTNKISEKLYNEGEQERISGDKEIDINKISEKRDSVNHDLRGKLWTQHQTEDCGALFGNGYSSQEEYCKKTEADGGDIVCWWNKKTEASVCKATNLQIDVTKIFVSNGGEQIHSVQGREEVVEFPRYEVGAFTASCQRTSNAFYEAKIPYYMNKVFAAFDTKPQLNCQAWVEKPALFITRYEYANLYHTMTDWYNTFQTQQIFSLKDVMVVFLDGHSQSAMDDGWKTLFGDIKYVKQFLNGPTCFRQAYFVPAGYASALSVKFMDSNTRQCRKTKWLMDFVQTFLNNLGLEPQIRPHLKKKIVIVFRRDYVAHPRVRKAASRKISNENEILEALRQKFPSCEVDFVTFETMNMKQQIATVMNADVLIGVHGAGLSHVLFSPQNAAVVELFPAGFSSRRHFEYFSAWAGIKHIDVDFPGGTGDTFLPVPQVIHAVQQALQ